MEMGSVSIVAVIVAAMAAVFGLVERKKRVDAEATLTAVRTRHANEAKQLASQVHDQTRLRSTNEQLLEEKRLLTDETRSREEQLQKLRNEVESLKQSLERRPISETVNYTVITLGILSTGKTSLTLKWANPLTVQTKTGTTYHVDTYLRTISSVNQDQQITTHVFEVRDWSGEKLQDAHDEFYKRDIRGMLFVVDLADGEEKAVNQARIDQQLEEFNKHALKWLFTPETTAKCKTVVLFINKADLISGRPHEVEEKAKQYYKSLIDALSAYKDKIDVRVIVGSAETGYNVNLLYSHFIEKILPKNAYDPQLLQKATTSPNDVLQVVDKTIRIKG